MATIVNHIFERQSPSRRPPKVGDVFLMRLKDVNLRGRVVSTSARSDSFSEPNCVLLYIYKNTASDDTIPTPAELSPPILLIPPVITNAVGWRRGYFRTIGNVELDASQKLAHHVFRDPVSGSFYDENSQPTQSDAVNHLTGIQVLKSYVTIEDSISQALGRGPTIHY